MSLSVAVAAGNGILRVVLTACWVPKMAGGHTSVGGVVSGAQTELPVPGSPTVPCRQAPQVFGSLVQGWRPMAEQLPCPSPAERQSTSTATEKLHVSWLAYRSTARYTTWVTPSGKNEPTAMLLLMSIRSLLSCATGGVQLTGMPVTLLEYTTRLLGHDENVGGTDSRRR